MGKIRVGLFFSRCLDGLLSACLLEASLPFHPLRLRSGDAMCGKSLTSKASTAQSKTKTGKQPNRLVAAEQNDQRGMQLLLITSAKHVLKATS